jgi:hypothetical protein
VHLDREEFGRMQFINEVTHFLTTSARVSVGRFADEHLFALLTPILPCRTVERFR